MQEPGLASAIMASAQTAVAQTGLVFILCFFLLLTREEFRIKFIAFQPTLAGRVRAARVFRDVGRRVTGYMVTFSIINLCVGDRHRPRLLAAGPARAADVGRPGDAAAISFRSLGPPS